MKLVDLIGWYGMLAILTSFFLISFNYVESSSVLYQTLNLTGALGILANAFMQKAYPSVGLNAVYALIALIALARIIFG